MTKRTEHKKIGHSCDRNCTKIHAAVDAYKYSLGITISGGQRNDVKYAIPVLENLDITGNNVLTGGYDCWEFIDYIYDNSNDLSITLKKGTTFEHQCGWFQLKKYSGRKILSKTPFQMRSDAG